MKVCLYIRLSKADTDQRYKVESDSIANQRALLHRYLQEHREFFPYEVVEIVDDGFTGTNGNRPGFERMITFLKSGGAKLVLCKDLSRFFRDYVETGEYLERIFPVLGVRLIAVNDGYDSDDYKGTTAGMDVVMRCIVYSYYSKDNSQKIRTALDTKVRRGKYIWASAPYGYVKDPEDKNHLVPDPVAAHVVRRIFALTLDGCTTSEIARRLNDDHVEPPAAHFRRLFPDSRRFTTRVSSENSWTSTNVLRVLHCRVYTGAVVSARKYWNDSDIRDNTIEVGDKWVVFPDCHEALISMDEFESAQQTLRQVKQPRRQNLEYRLRSLVRCGVCGRIMGYRRQGPRSPAYFRCCKNLFSENSSCPTNEHFNEEDLERSVIRSLSQMLQNVVDNDRRIQEAAARTTGTVENAKRSILRIDQAIRQNNVKKMEFYEQYSEGSLSRESFLQRKAELTSEMDRLTAEKSLLTEQLSTLEQVQNSELHDTAEAAVDFLRAENVTNEMLRRFIDRVNVFSGGRVEIVYRFSAPYLDAMSEVRAGADID